jgi:hypothetical protein
MIDLKDYINESLLDDFEDIVDKLDDNPFSLILDAKSEKDFIKAIDNLLGLCDKININNIDQKTHKNSFFLSNVCYMSGKPLGIVIDKMLKKSSKSILIRSVYNFTTGDDESKWVYYFNEKMDINYNKKYDIYDEWLGNFDTYLLHDLYIMPKYLEKYYLDIVGKLRPRIDLFTNKFKSEIILSGERLIKKIS